MVGSVPKPGNEEQGVAFGHTHEPLIKSWVPPIHGGTKTLVPEIAKILVELQDILVERGSNYADIEDNSQVFAELMTSLGVAVPEHMPNFMYHCLSNIATKLARASTGDPRHEDTWLDIANYSILLLACIRRDKKRAEPKQS